MALVFEHLVLVFKAFNEVLLVVQLFLAVVVETLELLLNFDGLLKFL